MAWPTVPGLWLLLMPVEVAAWLTTWFRVVVVELPTKLASPS